MKCFFKSALSVTLIFLGFGQANSQNKIDFSNQLIFDKYSEIIFPDTIGEKNARKDIEFNVADSLLQSIEIKTVKPTAVNKIFAPWIFYGYRHISTPKYKMKVKEYFNLKNTSEPEIMEIEELVSVSPSSMGNDDNNIILPEDSISALPLSQIDNQLNLPINFPAELYVMDPDFIPEWLLKTVHSYKMQEDFVYNYMIDNPSTIQYAFWELPVPPTLYEEDMSFAGYLKRLKLPAIDKDEAIIPEEEIKKRHWLHKVGVLLQFSQAYVSSNWYQGGNDYLALLFNFNWNVDLNKVYHPNLLFQSALSYKVAMNSTPQDSYHKYSIAEDLLQYNLNTGIKAYKNWFYSLNLLFKTQLFNNFEQNSNIRTASFLSPGDLNLGLGMSYSHANKYNTFEITATISPLSYNLKTCISDKVNHEQFNISPWKKTKSEIGSNAEINMRWDICPNISYKTRLFLFSDYSYLLSDWENTFSFQINKFLSTQLYIHLRYDSSSHGDTSWKDFMMREILSFGISYNFSTAP